MATNFPEDLDSFINPQATDSVAIVSHASQHADANDAIEALQEKVGTNNSTNPDSLDYRVSTLENASLDTEEVQDIIGALFTSSSHTNIDINYDDQNNTLSLTATYSDENVMDAIATALTAGYGITKTYNDLEDKIIIEVNTDSIATQEYVDNAISALVDAAPGLLDTLNEIAAAIGDDANFATTINNAISSAITTATNNAKDYTDQEISALSTVYDPLGSATTAETNAKNYADGLAVNYDPVGSAATAEENAKDYADGLAVNYDPAGSAATAESNANQYTDNQISNLTTDSFLEGPNNKYFTTERAQDAAGSALTGGTHSNISVEYDDLNGHINLTATVDNAIIVDAIATSLTAGTGITKTINTPPNYVGDYNNGAYYNLNDVVSIPQGSPYGNPGEYYIRSGNPSNPGYPPGDTNSWTLYSFSETITISVDTSVIATQSYVNDAISDLIDNAPAALDTLNEIAAALGDDSNFASTITNALATKITASSTDTLTNKTINLADNTITGTLAQFNTALTDADFATTTDVSDALADANTYTDTAVETHSDLISGVHGVTGNIVGTSDTQTLTNKTMGNDLLMDGNQISGLGTPTQADHAATKAYVDAVKEGLHVHAPVHAATTTNIASFTGITTLIIDGHTLQNQERVLVKDQTNAAENGIYVYDSDLQTLTRALDYNTATEIDAGDFIFVQSGNTYNNTGWVQENDVVTLETDPISWIQFSGAGTYLSGNGLNLDGNIFSIDESITATKSYVDTQDAATLSSANNYTDAAVASLGNDVEAGYIPISEKATAGGVASLNLSGKVPDTQLDIDERIQDIAAGMITGGTHTNITTSYNDTAGTISLTGIPLTQEQVQDFVAPLFAHNNHVNITATYDDNNNRVILQGQAGGGGGGATDIALIIGLS